MMSGHVAVTLFPEAEQTVYVDFNVELSATDDTDNEANLNRAIEQAVSKLFDRLRANRAVLAESRLQARQEASVQIIRKGVPPSDG